MRNNKILVCIFYAIIIGFSFMGFIRVVAREEMMGLIFFILSLVGVIALMSTWSYEVLEEINRKLGK